MRVAGRSSSLLALVCALLGACATTAPAPSAPTPSAATNTPPAQAPAPEPEWRQARAQMRKSCAAKEWDTCYAATARAAAATSGNADLVYNLGAIEALRGHREEALAGLARYAALGLGFDAAADEDFAPLKGDPRFAALLGTLAQNRASAGAHTEVARLAQSDLLAEDVAYHPATKTFYVSSVHTRQVLVLPEGGPARTLLAPAPGLFGIFALGLDAARGRLWVTTGAVPQALGHVKGDAGRTALLAVSLEGGGMLQRFDLGGLGSGTAGEQRLLGDLTVGPDGTVYVSDALGAVVYRLAPGGSALEPLVGREELLSPQTPALEVKSNTLYVPDYLRGLARIELNTRAVRWVSHGDDVALNGLDGLYLRSPRELIAVQNGTVPPRVLRLRLDDSGDRVLSAEVLARGEALLGDPTHAVLVTDPTDSAGDAFVVLAHSGWSAFGEDGALKPGALPEAPRLLRLPLGPRR